MIAIRDRYEIIERLGADPLGNVVLLKHLVAFPQHARAFQRCSPAGTATLVLLDTAASDYDRKNYPTAAHAAILRSNDAALTDMLLSELPADGGILFKLSSPTEHDVLHRRYPLVRKTSFLSFTSPERVADHDGAFVADSAADAMYALYRTQDHERDWLSPLLAGGRAFTCVIGSSDEPLSVCLAFESYGSVWEIGGVVTRPDQRGRGLGARVVGAALAELARRGLLARYQVHEGNIASIRLAESLAMKPLLRLTHYLHER
ncbi:MULTISPECIES: GNAT family N-acetyltransferase [Bosea]|uniref:GNAT family N-acetyltransferase n=1 Tax=Bosea TaxID=85413 RepID=UPI00214F97CB|nr:MULTISPECIES: GNAT family N-acetyltransferase [Bosea]MCR4521296.1 GNAT family N-acetyltransferase [Bosea sp. 47.2.35]MDR6826720.1 GNAT superfamily N-acetyltransferase [Bosea robiniae]MDR6893430.1 GNAT superfamily N-acetyltransferase [Bosea sp. BE109]MDR7136871.1 GNAT superfamily N-acetyltransferase [Bosea sp. BE168]MDR7173570.1 GNAT superfamily N-acetyltransferase [Bosea sp. BE271]